MWERAHSYLIHEKNWSLYVSFLIFTGLALVMALPPGGQAAVISDYTLNLKMLFTIVYVVLYGIIAMNLGQQLQFASYQVTSSQLRESTAACRLCLTAQLAFALFITAPYWIVFKTISYATWLQIFWAVGHLGVYGFVLGLFGFWLAVLTDSEIARFNLKYAVFVCYLLSTLFVSVTHPLNPFHALSFILGGEQSGTHAFFFLESYSALALIGCFLLFLIRRSITNRERISEIR